jgi:glycosyltransferase involved in cell wall biosynthesis
MSIDLSDFLKNTFYVGEETISELKMLNKDNEANKDNEEKKDNKDNEDKKANEDNKDNEDKKANEANKDNEDKKDVGGWWKPSNNNKKRVMLCGTYPIGTSNGYSKVVYYISKYLGIYEDIELTIYGFQNVSNTNGKNIRNDIPKNVILYDAMANENPKRSGFGELEISNYIKTNPQDIIIIFNDNMITTALTNNIIKDCNDARSKFKLVSYMDQVYPYQKKAYIELLNNNFDAIIAFTPYWKDIAYKLGIKKEMPIYTFPHGFDTNLYYPIPKYISRLYFNYNCDDFMVLNLNRNQPRKCWDHTIIAWVDFVETHYKANILNDTSIETNEYTKRPVKLIVGTMINGYWNLWDVLENEVKFRNVPLEYVKSTIIEVTMPQQLSDKEINILYNCCDVGCNNCNGGGYELTIFECLGLGKPQVSSFVGGIKEYLNTENSTPIEPKIYQYLDNKTNGIGGKAELTDPHEFAIGFWKYLHNPELADKHGKNGRENILKNYRWETLVEYFYKQVLNNIIKN